jgi:hypothetical protein
MQRILSLTLLVLLALGLTSQLQADLQRIAWPHCDSLDTWTQHFCPQHGEFWSECMGEDGNYPPVARPCPTCSFMCDPMVPSATMSTACVSSGHSGRERDQGGPRQRYALAIG